MKRSSHFDLLAPQNHFLVYMFMLKINSSKMVIAIIAKSASACTQPSHVTQVFVKTMQNCIRHCWTEEPSVERPLPDGMCWHFSAQTICVLPWVLPEDEAEIKIQVQFVWEVKTRYTSKGAGDWHKEGKHREYAVNSASTGCLWILILLGKL